MMPKDKDPRRAIDDAHRASRVARLPVRARLLCEAAELVCKEEIERFADAPSFGGRASAAHFAVAVQNYALETEERFYELERKLERAISDWFEKSVEREGK